MDLEGERNSRRERYNGFPIEFPEERINLNVRNHNLRRRVISLIAGLEEEVSPDGINAIKRSGDMIFFILGNYDPGGSGPIYFRELLEVFNRYGLLKPEEIPGILEKEENIDRMYGEIILQVEQQSGFFQSYQNTDIFPDVEDGFKTSSRNKRVRWAKKRTPLKSDSSEDCGYFLPGLSFVVVNNPAPTQEEVIRALATEGIMPKPSDIYLHEMVHFLHHEKAKPYDGFFPWQWKYKEQRELEEALARRIGNDSIDRINLRGVNEDLTRLYKGKIDSNKAETAIHLIDQLMSFGLSLKDVINFIVETGKKMGNDNDESGRPYLTIKTYIAFVAKKYGLDEGDLRDLMFLYRIERATDRMEAVLIARKALRKYK